MFNPRLANNVDLRARRLIQTIQSFQQPASVNVMQMSQRLVTLFIKHDFFNGMTFPSRETSLKDTGEFISKIHDRMASVMNQYNEDEVFVLGGQDPDLDHISRFLTTSEGHSVEGAAELLVEMCKAWQDQNDQYAVNRIKSIRKQLVNMGYPAKDIETICKDPSQVRNLVHQFKQALGGKLQMIQAKKAAANVKDPVTVSEEKLWAKHKDWFLCDSDVDNAYMPNDGAVPYHILLGEIVSKIKSAGVTSPYGAWIILADFIEIGHAHMNGQASRKGWDQLKTMSDHVVNGVNVGALWREYVSDDVRCLQTETKTANPLLRGPLRILRLASVMFGLPGAFCLYNCTSDNFMASAIRMRGVEKELFALKDDLKFSKKGAEGLSIALTASWAQVLDACELFFARTGRNDLSVPKILSELTGLDTSMYDDLDARPWSLMCDIRGKATDRPDLLYLIQQEYVLANTPPDNATEQSTGGNDGNGHATGTNVTASTEGQPTHSNEEDDGEEEFEDDDDEEETDELNPEGEHLETNPVERDTAVNSVADEPPEDHTTHPPPVDEVVSESQMAVPGINSAANLSTITPMKFATKNALMQAYVEDSDALTEKQQRTARKYMKDKLAKQSESSDFAQISERLNKLASLKTPPGLNATANQRKTPLSPAAGGVQSTTVNTGKGAGKTKSKTPTGKKK